MVPSPEITYYDIASVEIYPSAHRHGINEASILHALDHALVVVDLEPNADPPKVLGIGHDRAGNLLEIIWLELADDVALVIHAMPLRSRFFDLLPPPWEESP